MYEATATAPVSDVPRRWAAMLFMALAASSPLLVFPEVVWPGGRWAAAGLAIVSSAVAVRLVAGRPPVSYLVALVALGAAIAWIRVADRRQALSHFTNLALGLLVLGALATWCRSQRRLMAAVGVFLFLGIGALAVGLAGTEITFSKIFQWHFIRRFPAVRLGLPGLSVTGFVSANALAGIALLVAPIALASVALPRRGPPGQLALRLAGLLTAGGAVAVVVVTQSRTVWAIGSVMLVVASFWLRMRWPWRLLAFAAGVGLPVSVILLVRRESLNELRRVAGGAWDSLADRLGMWQQGLDQLLRSPWLGIGLNEFRHVYRAPPEVLYGTAHAHNIFLQTALDLGIFGLLAYVGLFGWLLVKAHHTSRGPDALLRRIAAGAGMGLLGIHLFGLADAIALGAKVGLLQWFAAGLILAAWQLQRSAVPGGTPSPSLERTRHASGRFRAALDAD